MKRSILTVAGVVGITAVLFADEPQQREIRQERLFVVEEQEGRLFGFGAVRDPMPGPRHQWFQGHTVMRHFFAGQRVELDRALSGGFNVIILDEGLQKRDFEEAGYEPPTILHAGPNAIVVVDENGATQTIAAHAIDVVTRHPEAEKDEREEREGNGAK